MSGFDMRPPWQQMPYLKPYRLDRFLLGPMRPDPVAQEKAAEEGRRMVREWREQDPEGFGRLLEKLNALGEWAARKDAGAGC